MASIRSLQASRPARSWLAASLAAALLALAVVGPVLAARGPVRLTDPTVSPVQVQAGQSVTFSVTYFNGQGNGAASVVVQVGGNVYPLSAPAGTAGNGGNVVYSTTVAPPAGTWTVEFTATDKFGNTATLAGAAVTVVAPPPPPPPPPSPTPAPTPTPTPTPAAPVPPGGGGSTGGGGIGGGSGGGTGGGAGSGTGGGSSVGSGGSTGGSSGGGGAAGPGVSATSFDAIAGSLQGGSVTTFLDDAVPMSRSALGPGPTGLAGASGAVAPTNERVAPDWTDATDPSADRAAAGAVGPATAGVSGRDGWSSDPALAVAFPGLGGGLPLGQILTTTLVTLGGLAMAMSFMLFGRRRRDDDPTDTDEALASAAASGSGVVAAGSLVGGLGGSPLPAPVGLAPAPVDAELDMPRWRRPSLLAARKEDPLRAVHTDAKLTFGHGAVAPIEGHERRVIRYRLVRLLDSPDELVAGEVGFLDEGDEVQLLQRSGAYWQVLCPDGRQGWVHRMVLGDVVDEDPPGPRNASAGRRPLPEERTDGSLLGPAAGIRLASAGQAAWSLQGAASTDAGMDIDDDVLRAYLAARAKG